MMKLRIVALAIATGLCLIHPTFGQTGVLDVHAFGAVGDGKTKDTAALQKAIDQAHASGGGTVVLAGGSFLSGTLELKSHVTLQVEKGAKLLGSAARDDYRKDSGWYALLTAADQDGIAICGEGVIDGQGRLLAENIWQMVQAKKIPDSMHANRPDEKNRPMLIHFNDCRNVKLKDITLQASACWVQCFEHCEDLVLDHIRVDSVAFWNNDGVDIVDCRKVHVLNCDINSADDGICLKSHQADRACQDVLIEHCKVRSSASALKFGTASVGGFKRVQVRDLHVYDTYRSAVALEVVDGGTLEDVDISGVEARNTGNAVFIRLGQRRGDIGSLRNVSISDMSVAVPDGRPDEGYELAGPPVRRAHNLFPSSICGLPKHPVQNVRLKNITITYGGGGRRDRAVIPLNALAKVPEQEDKYPEFSMFGELPAWGFYCRHVEGVKFQNVKLSFRQKDYRSALVADDVTGLELDGFQVLSAGEEPVIVLNNVRGVQMRDCPTPPGAAAMIREQNGTTWARVPDEQMNGTK